jgi:hypothetical protein
MARIELHIEIRAPLARVAAFFVPQRMVYWYGSDVRAEMEVLGGAHDFQAGQKVRIEGRIFGREVSLTAVVTRYVPGRLLEWKFRDAHGVRGCQSWTLEPSPAGTRVVMLDDYEFPGRLGRLLDRFLFRHAVRRRDRLWLDALRRFAERA